jgi:hypothetical protein
MRWLVGRVSVVRSTQELGRPEQQVVAAVDAGLQHEFPSPHGIPVFKGVIGRSEPLSLRVRVFPHGARVGLMRVATRERPIKPTLVGTITAEGPRSILTYAISSRGAVLLALGYGLIAVVLAVAALVASLAAGTTAAWVCLALAAFAGVVFASYLAGVGKAAEEEELLAEWVATMFGRPRPD